jgi:hypothetical protein
VKVRLEDGEEKEIHIPGDIRNRWKTVEASVLASNAVAVELFDKKGTLLRAQELESEPGEEGEEGEDPVQKAISKSLKETNAVIATVAAELNKAFDKGKDAAAQSSDSLVGIVETLASHYAASMTSIHNVVNNMAMLQQQNAEQVATLIKQLAAAQSDDSQSNGLAALAGPILQGMGMAGAAGPAHDERKKKP